MSDQSKIVPNDPTLANELKPFLDNPHYVEKKKVIQAIMDHASDPEYPKHKLVQELEDNGLRWFANKVRTGYYDNQEV